MGNNALFILKIYLILILIAFSACGEPASKERNTVNKKINFSDTSQYEILLTSYLETKDSIIQQFFDETLMPLDFSGGILIAQNGQIIFEKYAGFQNRKDSVRMSNQSPLHLASVSKVLTSVAILKLVMKQAIKLDQKVSEILPKFPYKSITVRHLLNHRSGIANYAYFTAKDEIWNQNDTLSNKDVLKILYQKNIELEFKPNTKFSYCNTNYVLLALIIEKITSKSFPLAMRNLIFEPLNMQHTFVMDPTIKTQNPSYKSTYEEIPLNILDATYGDKNTYSTPRDLLLFDLAIRNSKFLSGALKKEMQKAYSHEKPGIKNYGLGLRIKNFPGYRTIYYHTGWWHGNTAMYVHLAEENVCMIALSNKFTKRIFDIIDLCGEFGNYPKRRVDSNE